jgi:hypothetical protein
MLNFKFQKRNKNKGFTVLFAVIVSALVLAIGISIANITLKQIIISSSGRESQIAFYAADSGAECVMYYDLNEQAFATSSDSEDVFLLGEINCFGTPATIDHIEDARSATSTVELKYGIGNNFCAVVEIGKHDTNADGYSDKTIIQSRGYNTCDKDNPRRLERGLEIKY